MVSPEYQERSCLELPGRSGDGRDPNQGQVVHAIPGHTVISVVRVCARGGAKAVSSTRSEPTKALARFFTQVQDQENWVPRTNTPAQTGWA